jgi:hypothetical protein
MSKPSMITIRSSSAPIGLWPLLIDPLYLVIWRNGIDQFVFAFLARTRASEQKLAYSLRDEFDFCESNGKMRNILH